MTILNMIAQGNGWWWGGNIWEPLNLTVSVSAQDATITWEDNEISTIPPTAFAQSVLVRKVGSAPATPSDWTVVVTETVKDTYKTNWYVDSWLTYWTTYYYRVFSYSDLGGISYCDAVSVTPTQAFVPWANTLAYYPLTTVTTYTDQSENHNDLTNNWIVFGTYQWVDCASMTGTQWWTVTINALPSSWARTILCWCYIISPIAASTEFNVVWYWENWYHKSYQLYYNDWQLSVRTYYDDAGMVYNTTTMQNYVNKWMLLWWVYDWTDNKLYIDKTAIATVTVSLDTWSKILAVWKWPVLSKWINWYVSEVIVEDKAWSAQDIEDYYEATKWKYWIS